jgi:hypothetical protein
MEVRTITSRDICGGSLGGQYSVPLCNWLGILRTESLKRDKRPVIIEIVEAMQLTYQTIFDSNQYKEYDFRASIDHDDGWINISCPGDACDINPSNGRVEKGLGYEFSSHNVDTPAQQLTLLVGLAALHDKARREIKEV